MERVQNTGVHWGDAYLAASSAETQLPVASFNRDFDRFPEVRRFEPKASWRYYALEVGDVDLADRIRAERVRGFHKLAQTPSLGHFRSDLADEPLRFRAVRQYLIIYQSEVRPIEIVRVLHGARDVRAILGG